MGEGTRGVVRFGVVSRKTSYHGEGSIRAKGSARLLPIVTSIDSSCQYFVMSITEAVATSPGIGSIVVSIAVVDVQR